MMTETSLLDLLRDARDQCAAAGEPLSLLAASPDDSAYARSGDSLHELSRAMRVHCARRNDVIVRRPQNMIFAILPRTPPAGAQFVGEQIVDAMLHGPVHDATASVGLATIAPGPDDDPASFLARALRALHAAQNRGGNCCVGAASVAAPRPLRSLTRRVGLLLNRTESPGRRRHND